MTGQKKTIRRKNEYEIGTEYFDKEPLLYGKEKDHGQGADAPFGGITAGTARLITMPVCMDLLTATMARCTRRFRGTTEAGTAAPAVREAATIPISEWRCVNRRVSSTQAVLLLPARIKQPQGQ